MTSLGAGAHADLTFLLPQHGQGWPHEYGILVKKQWDDGSDHER